MAALLRERGRAVHPLTLSGLSDRSVGAAGVGLDEHVEDVVTLLEDRDLHEVVLLGHSYAGLVAGMVADRAADRVAHTVFLDANVPVDGASMVDGWSAAGQDLVRASIAGHEGLWPAPEPEDLAGHDLTDDQVADLLARSTGHPGRTLLEPASLTRPMAQLSATFAACTLPDGPEQRPHVEALRGAWDFVELETGHWPMVAGWPVRSKRPGGWGPGRAGGPTAPAAACGDPTAYRVHPARETANGPNPPQGVEGSGRSTRSDQGRP